MNWKGRVSCLVKTIGGGLVRSRGDICDGRGTVKAVIRDPDLLRLATWQDMQARALAQRLDASMKPMTRLQLCAGALDLRGGTWEIVAREPRR